MPEDLVVNARAVFSMAPRYCQQENNCLLYHQLWPLARIARGAPYQLAGREFFLSRLRRRLQAGTQHTEARILIAGAADTALLNLVHDGCADANCAVAIVLADRCETVIQQNRQFANQLDIELECHRSDLLQLDCQPVDIIVAHSVFTFIAPADRPSLYAQWHKLLREGGEVLLSSLMHRVMPEQAFVPSSSLTSAQFLAAAKRIGLSAEQQEALTASLKDGWQFRHLVHRAPVIDDFLAHCAIAGFRIGDMEGLPFLENERGPMISGEYADSQRVQASLLKQ